MNDRSRSRPPFRRVALLCLLVGLFVPATASADPTPAECGARANDTPAKLIECVQTPDLQAHMQAFQDIADANPGPDGHASRNSGEPGYKASADYVAQKMQDAGYDVTEQKYQFPYSSFVGTPTFTEAGRRRRTSRSSTSGIPGRSTAPPMPTSSRPAAS